MPQNLVEKIAQRFAVNMNEKAEVHSGDYITLQPAHILTHDNTGAIMKKFQAIGAQRIAHPRQPVFALDHNVQDTSPANLDKYKRIEAFAKQMGVDFYPAGRGIGHQIMIEEGYAFPGTVAVASDSHANMYGGLGCLGTPVVRTDAAAIWATGQTWWQIPPVAKVSLMGTPEPGVTGKDIILSLIGHFNQDEVLNHALEFTGPGLRNLSIEARLTIANMTTEWGALVGLFPVDDLTLQWLEDRVKLLSERDQNKGSKPKDHPRLYPQRIVELKANPLYADPEAYYAKVITIDLSTITPQMAGPDQVKKVVTNRQLIKERIKIHKAYLVSCVNSRVEDLAAAAKVVEGHKVADHVEFYLAAASQEVQVESERRGDWQTLLEAGAQPLPPGCGPCIGLGKGLLQEGEVGVSATNRNFKGRMGSREAECYLASPAAVAASAIAGYLTLPEPSLTQSISATITVNPAPDRSVESVTLLSDFPSIIEGTLVFCPQDNLNTDGIFPGKYTYLDNFSPEDQARVVMENYDPEFTNIVQEGDLLVGGFNFGTGSSREQAATALKYRGIRAVIAGSFSQTYKRNAFNNGFLVVEAPLLVSALQNELSSQKPTLRTAIRARLDFARSTITVNSKTYPMAPLGLSAQEIILAGGLEMWVRRKIK